MDFIKNDTPSMNSVYDSDYYNETRNYSQDLANNAYKKARNPYKTGIVPNPASSSMFMEANYNQPINDELDYHTSLSGERIPISQFKHGNMQHFLKKGITQNTDLNNNQKFYNKFGYNEYKTKKTEVEGFFQPTTDMSYLRGMTNDTDFLKDRNNSVITQHQNNFNPIQSVKVAPGLNLGYTSEGSGGFQQADTSLYVKPKSLEELRPTTDQRSTIFEVPIQAPAKNLVDKRGVVTPFAKNKPEKVYKKTEDDWFKGQSSVLKESLRAEENLKDTTRIGTHLDYYGGLKDYNQLSNDNDDYGKSSITIYDTEKHELAKQETPVANFSSAVKAIIAPITDAIKISMKEYFLNPAREFGELSVQAPDKSTTYDPVNHILKTTIKETNIHDSQNLNLTANKETYSASYDDARTTIKETMIDNDDSGVLTGQKEGYTALYDEAKTTIKETNIHDSENLNLTANKETYSASYDDARTTMKETSIHDQADYGGYIRGRDLGYKEMSDKPKKTIKETIPALPTTRNINNVLYKSTYVYDPKIVAKTTMKETLINNDNCSPSAYGFISGFINNLIGGYNNKDVELKNTQRQFLHCEYNPGLKSHTTFIPTNRDAVENMEIDETRELIMMKSGYTPNGSGGYIGVGGNEINMSNKKQIDLYECNEETRNVSKIYDNPPELLKEEQMTRNTDKLNNYNDRLDVNILKPLTENNDIIKINPIPLCE